MGDRDLHNNMYFDLETFRDSLFAENQLANMLSSSYIFFLTVYIVASSAILKVCYKLTEASILRILDRD